MAYKKLKYWFDKDLAIMLSDKICEVKPDFNRKDFVNNVDRGVVELELKDRVELMADELYKELGEDYTSGIRTLMKIVGPENPNETGMFTEYYWLMPIAKYIEKYGLDDFDISMKAIEDITKRNTGEYAIRPYIVAHPEKAISVMHEWSKNENFHIRRLSCEGLRPRLPWAKKLDMFIENPNKIIPILENLKDDKVKYVQNSVANCINDILKDNLEIGLALIESWSKGQIGKERQWIIKHATRKLNKK
ncbi:MAG: DNA alkylation repair protein [Candidatus Kapaibacterium sp.]